MALKNAEETEQKTPCKTDKKSAVSAQKKREYLLKRVVNRDDFCKKGNTALLERRIECGLDSSAKTAGNGKAGQSGECRSAQLLQLLFKKATSDAGKRFLLGGEGGVSA